MMMGVAQVMGMKPTLRSFFSGAPPWAKASRAVASGNTEEMAAIAVAAPTFFRNSRRWASTGKTARRTAASTTRLKRCSSLAGTADRRAWSAGAWSPPQPQRCLSRALGSNGSLNMVEKPPPCWRRWRVLEASNASHMPRASDPRKMGD